jgi:hypothetical protein
MSYQAPKLNWGDVLQSLDYPGFALRGIKALEVIMTAFRQATQQVMELSLLFKGSHLPRR